MYSQLERAATIQRFRQHNAPKRVIHKDEVEKMTAWPQHLFHDGVKYTEKEVRDCCFTIVTLGRVIPQLCRDQKLRLPQGYFEQWTQGIGNLNAPQFNEIVVELMKEIRQWNYEQFRA